MLIAMGLINWRYQSAESSSAANSLIIIGIGVVLVALLFLPATKNFFSQGKTRMLTLVIVAGAVIFAILN